MLFDPGHSLEGVATFNPVRHQHFGFAVTYSVDGTPWAIISTGPNGDGLYARTYTGSGAWDTQSTPIEGSYLGTPHLYRVDWFADHVDYYIDDTLVATHNVAISTQMRPMPANSDVGGQTMTVDWLRMTPFATAGSFFSRIFDAGAILHWQDLTWSGSQPTGTTISIATRTGNVPNPNDSWSIWQPVNSPIVSPNGRYFQYWSTLTTTDTKASPVVEDVTISYQLSPTAATVVSFIAEPHLNTILLSWQTAIEVELLGFNLYRSDSPDDPLNQALILANAPGSITGATYQFADRTVEPGKTYNYILEIVSISGQTRLAPITATAPYTIYIPLLTAETSRASTSYLTKLWSPGFNYTLLGK